MLLRSKKKAEILRHKQVKGVIREKEIMEKVLHPFLIDMVNAFQDDKNLYMVLKLYPGGELYNMLHQKKSDGVKKSVAIFYAAGILQALDFMHLKSVIYRDLKPENVLLDEDGYCVIVDMGFAKVVTEKTYTLCGTPLYIAPEVVLSRGHDKGADIWSLGILIFEMIYGFTPFYEDGMDQLALFKGIVRCNLRFPPFLEDPDTMDLIKRMLNRRSAYRLGCLKDGAQDLRNHAWFGAIDFKALGTKKINAPWKPRMKDPFDVKFDDWSSYEKDDDKYPTLSKKEQSQFAEF